ncbi:hypothetical protein MLD38_039239 [Melastoma candidum]|uniref:Uncharacterized protein n=1 Tax=Melastoma candidum TaxID=119954 RepID=A0ACB9L2I3_9MYRT|nr:hypothetical protein MLD38_039239 [Melastoma candidum]
MCLCLLEKQDAVRDREKMTTTTELHEVDGGDHSFKITKKHLQCLGSTEEAAEVKAVKSVAGFVKKIIHMQMATH